MDSGIWGLKGLQADSNLDLELGLEVVVVVLLSLLSLGWHGLAVSKLRDVFVHSLLSIEHRRRVPKNPHDGKNIGKFSRREAETSGGSICSLHTLSGMSYFPVAFPTELTIMSWYSAVQQSCVIPSLGTPSSPPKLPRYFLWL